MEISGPEQVAIVDKIYTNRDIVTISKAYMVSDYSRLVAVKEMYFDSVMEASQLIREAYEMQRISHPNILKALGLYLSEDQTSVSIVTDFYQMGDLNEEIKRRQKSKQFWTETELYSLSRQLISAFAYLQRMQVAHRDIKPHNILLSKEQNQLKLTVADLGCATKQDDFKSFTLRGAPPYLSPILRRAFQSNTGCMEPRVHHDLFKSDVYSLGLTLLFMASLEDIRSLGALQNLQNLLNERLQKLAHMPWTQQILSTMLQIDEEIRWDFIQIQQYFFSCDVPGESPYSISTGSSQTISSSSIHSNYQDISMKSQNSKADYSSQNSIREEAKGKNYLENRQNIPINQAPQDRTPRNHQRPSIEASNSCLICLSNPIEPFNTCGHEFVCKNCKKTDSLFEKIYEKLTNHSTSSGICPLCYYEVYGV